MRIVLSALLLLSLSAFADTVYQRIEEDLALTADQRATYFIYSVMSPEKLPVRYTADANFNTSGTPALHEANLLIDEVSPEVRNLITSAANRPTLSGTEITFVTSKGRFLFHYTTSGVDASSKAYAEAIAVAYEHCWDFECGDMGYLTPPPDNGAGGSDLYDVYIRKLAGSTLGYTSQGGEFHPPDSSHNTSASHICMTLGLQEQHQKCTSSHEFQHAIQMTYDCQETTWFMENCAVWMEDRVYDEYDDYLGYYGVGAMKNPHKDISSSAMYWYGASYWPRMMGVMYGIDAVKEVWENCAAVRGPNMWEALDEMFKSHGSSFENGFMQYGLWRYMVGENYSASYNLYDEEAADWGRPLVLPWNKVKSFPHTADQGTKTAFYMKTRGITWIRVDLSSNQGGWVQMDFNGRDALDWNLGAILFNKNKYQFKWFDCDASGDKTVSVPTAGWDYAIFFPARIAKSSLSATFEYTVSYTTGIEDGGPLVSTELSVGSNPVVAGATLSFNLPTAGHANLSIMDMSGRKVSTLFNGQADMGLHTVEYQEDIASGSYFVVLTHENSVESTRVAIIR